MERKTVGGRGHTDIHRRASGLVSMHSTRVNLLWLCGCLRLMWSNAWQIPLPGGGRVVYEGGLLRIRTSEERLPAMPAATSIVDPAVLSCIEIRDTQSKKGFGAYATRPLLRHTFLGFYHGILRDSLEGLDNIEYLMSLDGGVSYLDGYERAQDRSTFSPVHLNHADKPYATCVRVFQEGRCAFFTARDIEKDEELTFDYGKHYWIGREHDKL